MSLPYDLAGKKALVTGGRRRIGRGIAIALAESGAEVGINDLEADFDAEMTLQMIREMGTESEFYSADISDIDQVEQEENCKYEYPTKPSVQ